MNSVACPGYFQSRLLRSFPIEGRIKIVLVAVGRRGRAVTTGAAVATEAVVAVGALATARGRGQPAVDPACLPGCCCILAVGLNDAVIQEPVPR